MFRVSEIHRKSMDIFEKCDLFAAAKNNLFWKQMFVVVVLIMLGT